MGATRCTQRDWKRVKDIESLTLLALFVFCSGGGTHVQLPLAKYEIYLTFSKSIGIQELKSFITKL